MWKLWEKINKYLIIQIENLRYDPIGRVTKTRINYFYDFILYYFTIGFYFYRTYWKYFEPNADVRFYDLTFPKK